MTRRRLPAALAVLALAACDRGPPEESGEDPTVVARTSEGELPAWLTPVDGTDPARWLAGREAGHALPAEAAQVRAMRDVLVGIRDGFVEDPRMIANRTAQLGEMLAATARPEDYRRLLTDFGLVARRYGHRRSLYGEMCQHYVNLRSRGLPHEAAIAALAARRPPAPDAPAPP